MLKEMTGTLDPKHQHAALSVEFIEMTDDSGNVFKKIVTGDESSFHVQSETNCQSATSLSPKIPKTQKVKIQKSQVKTMSTAFFMVEVSLTMNLSQKNKL
jgi:hypothetical protein